MDAGREAWTDERLDDFANRVDRGFDRVDAKLVELEGRMDQGFARVDAKFVELETRMDQGFARADAESRALRAEMNQRFDSLQRTMVLGFGSIVASALGGIAAAVAGNLI